MLSVFNFNICFFRLLIGLNKVMNQGSNLFKLQAFTILGDYFMVVNPGDIGSC